MKDEKEDDMELQGQDEKDKVEDHRRMKKQMNLKVHKREKSFGSDFEFFTILQLIKLKY